MVKKLKDFTLPIAIVLGFLFHGFFASLNAIIPWLIFTMLFFTLCSIDIRKMQISWLHIIMTIFQVTASIGLYLAIKPFNETLAQGSMAIILAPTATSAPVIAAILGANLNTMVAATLLSNVTVAIVSPLYFSWAGLQGDIPFLQSSWMVLSKVAPLIIFPLLMALFTQRFLPKASKAISKHKDVSFYLWAVSLTIVIGRTIDSILQMDRSKMHILFVMMALSIAICAVQFSFGRWIGKRYGDRIAGGQSVGQKNTVLAIWMAQTYMAPLASVIPAMYVLWQNLFNSYQIWDKGRRER